MNNIVNAAAYRSSRGKFIRSAVSVLLGSLLFISTETQGQAIPQFNILRTNNKVFNSINLPKNRPVIIIYFDPDCEHCQILMNNFFRKIASFKAAEIVLATFKPVSELVAFEKKYGTGKYANIIVGTEGTVFYLRMFYKITTLPFTALYDKKGNLNYAYKKDTSVEDLIKRLKKIEQVRQQK